MESATIDLDGPVHYLHGGSGTATIVCVHGLGGSHVNWLAVAPRLARRYRVLIPDLAGHGRTPSANRSASVQANARLLDRFVLALAPGPVILVGNSMGGLISMIETAAHPSRVAALVLVNPSLPITRRGRIDPDIARNFAAYAVPGLGERYVRARKVRLGPEGLVADVLRYCTVDPARVPADVVAASVALAQERMRMPWADDAFLEAARSLLRMHATRASVALIRRLPPVPTLLVHGARDRLVPLDSAIQASRLRPDWTLRVLDDVGHVPMLEVPGTLVDLVEGWLATVTPTTEPV
jgi:pimeloyl-ACP methyl ester carboxylesterase